MHVSVHVLVWVHTTYTRKWKDCLIYLLPCLRLGIFLLVAMYTLSIRFLGFSCLCLPSSFRAPRLQMCMTMLYPWWFWVSKLSKCSAKEAFLPVLHPPYKSTAAARVPAIFLVSSASCLLITPSPCPAFCPSSAVCSVMISVESM